MAADAFEFLQSWFEGECDGDWEHDFGVRIQSLDNPGWRVAINLVGTTHAGRTADRRKVDRSDQDWLHTWADGARFHAACGPRNLTEALEAFREFIRADDVESEPTT